VDRSRLFSAKEDKFGSISRKAHDMGVLGCWRNFFIDYLEKGKRITGEYYSNLLTRLGENVCEKSPGLQKKKSSFFRTVHTPTKVFCQWKIKGSALWIVGTFTLFPRFRSLWLLSLPKTQTLARFSAFFFESRGDCSCRGVFCSSYEEPQQGRDNGVAASIGQMC